MAGSTDRPTRLEKITIATVKRRTEARQLTLKLEAAEIGCVLIDERTETPTRRRLGGIKIQVDRADVGRALQILKHAEADSAPMANSKPSLAHFAFTLPPWLGSAAQVLAVLAAAVALAALFFY